MKRRAAGAGRANARRAHQADKGFWQLGYLPAFFQRKWSWRARAYDADRCVTSDE